MAAGRYKERRSRMAIASCFDQTRVGSIMADTDDGGNEEEQWPPARGLPAQSRYKPASKLEWGETPFDDLDRGELLRLVQAYHAAAVDARLTLIQLRAGHEKNVYWGPDGIGGYAVARLELLIARAGDGDMGSGSENISRSFFRYANGLLFEELAREDERWGIDESSGHRFAPFTPGDCSPLPHGQPLRAIQWSDLLPKNK